MSRSTKQAAPIIKRPKGSIGDKGFSLINEMKLDKSNPKDKSLYNDILVSCNILFDNRYLQNVFLGICP
jgi:hypothetical protein